MQAFIRQTVGFCLISSIVSLGFACKPRNTFTGATGISTNAPSAAIEQSQMARSHSRPSVNSDLSQNAFKHSIAKLNASPELFQAIRKLDTSEVFNITHLANVPDEIELAGVKIHNVRQWLPVIEDNWRMLSEEFPTYGDYLDAIGAGDVATLDPTRAQASAEVISALFQLSPDESSSAGFAASNESIDLFGSATSGEGSYLILASWTHNMERKFKKSGQWFKQTSECWGRGLKGVAAGAASTVLGCAGAAAAATGVGAPEGIGMMAAGSAIEATQGVGEALERNGGEIAGVRVGTGAKAADGVMRSLPCVGGMTGTAEDLATTARCFHENGHVGGGG